MSNQHERTQGQESGDGRRAFLKVGVGALSAGLATIVVAPALRAALWPLAEDAGIISGGDEFVVVGKREAFGSVPVRVDIYADRVDAWNRIKNVKIGSAWVVERDGKLLALSTVCPHLGCAVDYNAEAAKFECPCHDSAFASTGVTKPDPRRGPWTRSRSRSSPKINSSRSDTSASSRRRRQGEDRMSVIDWVDERTGIRKLLSEALDEPVPGGARVRYVFGSVLTYLFLQQVVLGSCWRAITARLPPMRGRARRTSKIAWPEVGFSAACITTAPR